MAEPKDNLADLFGSELPSLLTSLFSSLRSSFSSTAPAAAGPAAAAIPGAQTTSLLNAFRSLSTTLPVVTNSITALIGGVQGVIAPFQAQAEKYQAAVLASQKADEAHEKALKAVQKATEEYQDAIRQVAQVQKDAAAEQVKALDGVKKATEDYDAALTRASQAQRNADQVRAKETAAGPPTAEGQLRIDRAQTAADEAARAADRKKESVSEAEKHVEKTKTRTSEQIEQAQKTVVQRRESVTEATGTAQKTGQAAAQAGGAVEAAGGFAAALGPVVAAVGAVVGALEQAVASVKGFVEALSPGTILVFDQAIKDLQATIGVAFEPIFEILQSTIQQAAGIILPAMQALRPVIEQLTNTISSSLINSVKFLVNVFESLIPVLKVFATVFDVLTNLGKPLQAVFSILATVIGANLQILVAVLQPVIAAFQIVGAIFDAFADVLNVVQVVLKTLAESITAFITSLFGVDLKDVFQTIADVTKKVIEQMLIFVAVLAKTFGADSFLGRLIENLKPKSGEKAAASGGALKGFEQVVNDIQAAAATASGRTREEEMKKSLDDILKTLEDIRDGKGESKLNATLRELTEVLKVLAKAKETAAAVVATPGRIAAGGATNTELGLLTLLSPATAAAAGWRRFAPAALGGGGG